MYSVQRQIKYFLIKSLTRQEQKTFRAYPISELEIEFRRTLECVQEEIIELTDGHFVRFRL